MSLLTLSHEIIDSVMLVGDSVTYVGDIVAIEYYSIWVCSVCGYHVHVSCVTGV